MNPILKALLTNKNGENFSKLLHKFTSLSYIDEQANTNSCHRFSSK